MSSYGTPPKIGLALGSGASRGWSHIGVIKALLREGHLGRRHDRCMLPGG